MLFYIIHEGARQTLITGTYWSQDFYYPLLRAVGLDQRVTLVYLLGVELPV